MTSGGASRNRCASLPIPLSAREAPHLSPAHAEQVHVIVVPAHCHLDNLVQVPQRHVGRDQRTRRHTWSSIRYPAEFVILIAGALSVVCLLEHRQPVAALVVAAQISRAAQCPLRLDGPCSPICSRRPSQVSDFLAKLLRASVLAAPCIGTAGTGSVSAQGSSSMTLPAPRRPAMPRLRRAWRSRPSRCFTATSETVGRCRRYVLCPNDGLRLCDAHAMTDSSSSGPQGRCAHLRQHLGALPPLLISPGLVPGQESRRSPAVAALSILRERVEAVSGRSCSLTRRRPARSSLASANIGSYASVPAPPSRCRPRTQPRLGTRPPLGCIPRMSRSTDLTDITPIIPLQSHQLPFSSRWPFRWASAVVRGCLDKRSAVANRHGCLRRRSPEANRTSRP